MRTNTAATLYSRSVASGDESWARSTIAAVHWENRKAANVMAAGLLEADAVNVWIPGTSVSIKVGDVLVKGIVDKTIGATYTITNLKKDYPNSFTVHSVDTYDFGSPKMRHILVGGS